MKVLSSRRICARGEIPSFCKFWKNLMTTDPRLPCNSVMVPYPAVDADLFQYIADMFFDGRFGNRELRRDFLFGKPRNIMVNTSICLGVK